MGHYCAQVRFVTYMTPGFPVSMFETIADVIGAELHLEQTMSGPAPGTDPFADGTFDLGWICSVSFADLLLRRRSPSIRPAGVAWVPDDPDAGGRPVYFGDVVVPPGSPIRSFGDLRGATVGCNDPVSLSGNYALRFEIIRRGGDPDGFANLVFTGGHQRSLDMIGEGLLDAAVVDSVVRTCRARSDESVDGLRVIERLGPWPTQPMVASVDVPPGLLADMSKRLIEASLVDPLAAQLRGAALTGLVEVDEHHYAPVRRALARI